MARNCEAGRDRERRHLIDAIVKGLLLETNLSRVYMVILKVSGLVVGELSKVPEKTRRSLPIHSPNPGSA